MLLKNSLTESPVFKSGFLAQWHIRWGSSIKNKFSDDPACPFHRSTGRNYLSLRKKGRNVFFSFYLICSSFTPVRKSNVFYISVWNRFSYIIKLLFIRLPLCIIIKVKIFIFYFIDSILIKFSMKFIWVSVIYGRWAIFLFKLMQLLQLKFLNQKISIGQKWKPS